MKFSLALLQLLSVLSLFCYLNPISGQGLDNQKSSLLTLFGSPKILSWTPNTNCCTWDGVTCDHSTGYVIGIDLVNRSITGPINTTSLISLPSLQTLNLSLNNFDSSIPAALGYLSNLTHLNLSNSGFKGHVPFEITHIKSLVSLDLTSIFPHMSFNLTSLTLLDRSLYQLHLRSPNFGYLVGNLSELRELYLDGVNISSPLPNSLPELAKLTSLSLNECNLTGEFPRKIFHMQNLESLYMSWNELLTITFPDIPFENRLQILSLSGIEFYGEFPNFVGNLRHLQRLELRDCNFSGPIPLSVGVLTQLAYLDLSWNSFSREFHSLENLTQLVHLDLSRNLFSGGIPLIENLTQLVHLNLSGNSFSGGISSLKSHTQLVRLDLSYNNLSGTIFSFCEEQFLNMKELDLSSNSLSGKIPSCLFSLASLQQLYLNDNHFDAQLGEFENASVSLNEVLLSNNKLQGPIPRSLFQLIGLQALVLSFNNFTGTVDFSLFQNLKNLLRLDLSDNNLSIDGMDRRTSLFPQFHNLTLRSCGLAKFPNFLQDQAYLSYLDLSNNKIGGELPNWIWNIGKGSLKCLNLSNNNIIGQSPPSVYLNNLACIDLHSNKLQGSIPFLPSSAILVDYSNNNFTSALPPSICNATFVQFLDLSNNNLSGSIPQCLGQLTNLLVLNLGKNNLHGIIPQSFEQGSSLRSLNLNGNHVQGSLPHSLQNCKHLEVLNIGNNKIHDSFPSWLGSLRQLQVLILQSNKFYGPIQNPEGPNAFSQLQIVDLSSNDFSGSLTSEFFQNMKAMMVDEDEQRAKLQAQILEFEIGRGMSLYKETVTITMKGLKMEFVKILTILTSLDFSKNRFQGNIPIGIGNLTSIYGLNMSHNEFTGPIPSSFGNLQQLESLDLSANELSGEIPANLTALTFLSILNLSQNFLYGTIPQGNQFFTFSNDSFQDNLRLCGPPLSRLCEVVVPPESRGVGSQSRYEFDWKFIYFIGLGFMVGNWMVMGPIIFWTKGRRCFYKHVDKMLAMAKEWVCQGL